MDEPSRIESQLKKKDPPFLGSRIEKLIASLTPGGDSGGTSYDDTELRNLISDLQAAVDAIDLSNFVKKNVVLEEEGNVQAAGYQLRSQVFNAGTQIGPGVPSLFVEGWRIGWDASLNSTFFDFGATNSKGKNYTFMVKNLSGAAAFTLNYVDINDLTTQTRVDINPEKLTLDVFVGGTQASHLVNSVDLRTLGPYDDSGIVQQMATMASENDALNSRIEALNSRIEALENNNV